MTTGFLSAGRLLVKPGVSSSSPSSSTHTHSRTLTTCSSVNTAPVSRRQFARVLFSAAAAAAAVTNTFAAVTPPARAASIETQTVQANILRIATARAKLTALPALINGLPVAAPGELTAASADILARYKAVWMSDLPRLMAEIAATAPGAFPGEFGSATLERLPVLPALMKGHLVELDMAIQTRSKAQALDEVDEVLETLEEMERLVAQVMPRGALEKAARPASPGFGVR